MSLKNLHKIGKQKRIKLGFTQEQLSILSGLPTPTIKFLEAGKNTTIDTMAKYLGALEIIVEVVNGMKKS